MVKVILGLVPVLAGLALSGAQVSVESTGQAAVLDDRGGIVSLKGEDGRELISQFHEDIFRLGFCAVNDPQQTNAVTSSAAKSVSIEKRGSAARLEFSEVGLAEKVICIVRPVADGSALEWRISVSPRPGYRLVSEEFPRFSLAPTIGENDEDDRLVTGFNKGGVWHRPVVGEKDVVLIRASSPGGLAAQFGAYYDAKGGFWSAADDGEGWLKELEVSRKSGRLVFSWRRLCSETALTRRPFPVVTDIVRGPAETATIWQDAADRYKRLVAGRQWCKTPLALRKDLPTWMKDAPAMTRFLLRDWVENPQNLERWIRDYWQCEFGRMPLVVAMWGWEKVGYWVSPDYFPACSGDEAIRRISSMFKAVDAHLFAWPSGYHWTLWFGRRNDGTFAWDGRRAFEEKGAAHACLNRDGSYYRRLVGWFPRGSVGELSCLCGGDRWTIDFFNREIGAPLVGLGFEMIQVDQVVGGAYPNCWSSAHGHTPGGGTWMAGNSRIQLETLVGTMRKNGVEAPIVGFEEPCEIFNDLVGIQDYRDTEVASEEWASVFNYLYHEFVPCFQSNPRLGDRRSQAYCAADGQMPFMIPSTNDYTTARNAAYTAFMKRWTVFYHGEGRDFVAHGRHVRPPEVSCAKIAGVKQGTLMPAVFHGAFESLDGRRALVFANATPYSQKVTVKTNFGCREVTVEGDGLLLYPLESGDITRFDPRMAMKSSVVTNGVRWIDGRELPIEGRPFADVDHYYDRLPSCVTTNVNQGVREMKHHTTGMQFRFSTDSKKLHFRWKAYFENLAMGHMPKTGVSGIDIYRYDAKRSEWRYVKTGVPDSKTRCGTLSVNWTPDEDCLVNLPLYNGVSEFQIGLDESAEVKRARPHAGGEKPVVFYGTSITHGGCASRPGMSFVNIIGRDLDVPVVNLGFSGSGYMEFEMSEHLARIDASCYVLDCLWNMGTKTGYSCPGRNVEEVYEPFIRNLRTKRPGVPIVMAEECWVSGNRGGKDEFVRALYERLVAEGWDNLVYLPKDKMYSGNGEDTVDGIHPNDWGMMHMARAYGEAVRSALK